MELKNMRFLTAADMAIAVVKADADVSMIRIDLTCRVGSQEIRDQPIWLADPAVALALADQLRDQAARLQTLRSQSASGVGTRH